MKQGLILIKFLPVNSILSAKKWWMITAVVGQNKRQYQVLPMHETLYDIILSFYKIIGTFRVPNNYQHKIPECSIHFRCKLEQLLNTCRRQPLRHRCFHLMDQYMMASFRSSGIQRPSDHKTLLCFCLHTSYIDHNDKLRLHRFLLPLCTLMNRCHCNVSLKIN